MAEPMKGHEFLVRLKEQGDKRYESFDTLFHFMDQKAREKGIPLNGQFELTPLCNLDCRMLLYAPDKGADARRAAADGGSVETADA